MHNKFSLRNNHAVSNVFSLLLTVAIFFTSIGGILFVNMPVLDEMQKKSQAESINSFYNFIDRDITKISAGFNHSKSLVLNTAEGSVSFDSEGDREVVFYSFSDDYEFDVDGLEDEDKDFTVDMIDGDLNKVKTYWLDHTCFLGGTKVLMSDDSYKFIEDVEIGDFVKSYDEKTGFIKDCSVNRLFHHSAEEMTDYYLVINDDLCVTPNHRFYSDGSWVFADDLCVGDSLFSSNLNDDYFIESIERVYEKERSYDLSIDFFHNYFVNVNGVNVLVHNDDVDQEQNVGTMSMPMGDNDYFIQTFRPTESTLTKIQLLVNSRGTPSKDLIVSIHNGIPSRPEDPITLMDTVTKRYTEITVQDWYDFDFNPDLTLTAGNIYSIEVIGSGSDLVNCYYWSVNQNENYVNGALTKYNTVTRVYEAITGVSDGTFKTYYPGSGNSAPTYSNPIPDGVGYPEGTTDVTLSIDVADSDGDAMAVTFYDASDDTVIDSETGVSDGDTVTTQWSGLSSGQTYNWYVEIDDKNNPVVQTLTYSFSINSGNSPPEFDSGTAPTGPLYNGQPYNYYYNDTLYNFEINPANDADGDELSYNFSWGDGSYTIVGDSSLVPVGDPIIASHSWENASVYEIKVIANDSQPSYSDYSESLFVDVKLLNTPVHDLDSNIGSNNPQFITKNIAQGNSDTITVDYNIVGLVRIDLFSNSYPEDNPEAQGIVPFGRIWVFDLGQISYKIPSANGGYYSVFENYGILNVFPDNEVVSECSNFIEMEDTLFMRILQIIGAIQGSGSFEIYMSLNNSFIRESDYVYSLNIQFFGVYKNLWESYYVSGYNTPDFELINNPNTPDSNSLLYKEGKGVNLILSSNKLSFRLNN